MAWAMLTAMPDVPQLEVEEVERRSPEAVVLDVREPQEYAHGHVPGALNLPQAELASRMNEVPRDRPVLVICQSGYRALRSAQGGTAAWQASGKPLAVGDTSLDKPRIAESEWVHAGGAPTMSGAQ
jgi:rhodanese-related sulfurtransferase